MRTDGAFDYACGVHIFIDLAWTKAGSALLADMEYFQLPRLFRFLIAHLAPPYLSAFQWLDPQKLGKGPGSMCPNRDWPSPCQNTCRSIRTMIGATDEPIGKGQVGSAKSFL